MQQIKAHSQRVNDVAFSADGARLLSSSPDGAARIWDVATGKEVFRLRDASLRGKLNVAIFSPEGDHVLVGSRDGRLLQFDLAGKLLLDRKLGWSVTDLCFTRAGDLIVAATSAGQFCLAGDSLEGEPRWRARRGAYRLAVSGKVLACMGAAGSDELELRNPRTGESMATLPRPGVKHRDISHLAFSPDGKLLAGAANGLVRLWNVRRRAQVAEWSHGKTYFHAVAFTADGARLAAVGNDAHVHFWTTKSHVEAGRYGWKLGKLKCLAFSSNGCTGVVGSESGSVLIWDLD